MSRIIARRNGPGARRSIRSGIGVSSAPAAWSPANVAGLRLWLEDDRLITGPGGPPPTNVSTWGDSSGNAFNFTETLSSTRAPAYTGSPLAPTSDGVNDSMDNSSIITSGALTCAVRFKLNATPGAGTGQEMFDLVMSAGRTYLSVVFLNLGGYQNLTVLAKCGAAALGVGFSPTLDTSTHYIVITYNNGTNTSPASYTINYDGASQTVVASGLVGRTVTNRGSLFAVVTSGGTGSNFVAMANYKSIVYDTVLTGGDLTNLTNYVASA